MIVHIPNVLTQDELSYIRKRLENAHWVDGKTTAGAQAVHAKANMQLDENSVELYEIRKIISDALQRNALFISASLPLHTISPFVNRYEKGAYYANHVDNAILYDKSVDKNFRTDLSATLFFSHEDEYEGGEMIIEDTYGAHEIKLPAGDMILYPSTSLHRVLEVKEGLRLASFMWIQSMLRDPSKRAIMFELDQTIQELRLLHGETEQSLSLSIHYHKLLQQWAEI